MAHIEDTDNNYLYEMFSTDFPLNRVSIMDCTNPDIGNITELFEFIKQNQDQAINIVLDVFFEFQNKTAQAILSQFEFYSSDNLSCHLFGIEIGGGITQANLELDYRIGEISSAEFIVKDKLLSDTSGISNTITKVTTRKELYDFCKNKNNYRKLVILNEKSITTSIVCAGVFSDMRTGKIEEAPSIVEESEVSIIFEPLSDYEFLVNGAPGTIYGNFWINYVKSGPTGAASYTKGVGAFTINQSYAIVLSGTFIGSTF